MKDFSLQLYSLRDVPTLRERMEIAAKQGYTGVEFAGYEEYSAVELKALLDQYGLRATGSHISLEALQQDLDGCVRYCAQAGIQSAACPWATIHSRSETEQLAVFLETCAARFAQEGIVFAYHNHAHEFEKDGDDYLLEILLEQTQKLQCELDVYWAAYAGVDPLAFIQKYAGRFPLLHFKEISADRTNVELGRGVLDFSALVRTGLAQGTKEFIVEQEEYTMPPIDSVGVDAAYMQTL